MRRTLFLLTALALATAGTSLAQAAQSADKAEEQKPAQNAATVSGTLVSIDESELVLKTVDGDRRFAIDEQTEVPADLSPDTEVKVTFQKKDDGRLHARRVSK